MSVVKDIHVRPITSRAGNDFVRKHHYSKSVVMNSTLHLGCFLNGVLQYGNSIDKRNVIGFVDTGLDINKGWNSFLELNRLAFDDRLPKNSESRCIAVSIKILKKRALHIKWILSYADGTQCGDGTIYRGSGFKLCGINKNSTIYRLPDGRTKAKHGTSGADFSNAKKLEGNQLRYIYIIDKSCKINLPTLEFSEIDDFGAGMYLGKKITLAQRTVA